jgi:hypothetical protein
MTISIKRIEYAGWPTCYRVSNDHMQLVITAEVGPRIIDLRLPDGENILYQFPEQIGKMDNSDEFRFYGGHRLWHAPEHPERTYQPDNEPVEVKQSDSAIQFIGSFEYTTGIQKQLDIIPHETHIVINHTLINHNLWDVTLAPWALTMIKGGGTAIMPLPPRGSHDENLQPTSNLAIWAYTDLSDPRWTFGRQYLLLHQNSNYPKPQKIGASPVSWLACAVENTLFIKEFSAVNPPYPDNNSNAELFTDAVLLELESLGTLTTLTPGASISHQEIWTLHSFEATLEKDNDVTQHVLPHLTHTRR